MIMGNEYQMLSGQLTGIQKELHTYNKRLGGVESRLSSVETELKHTPDDKEVSGLVDLKIAAAIDVCKNAKRPSNLPPWLSIVLKQVLPILAAAGLGGAAVHEATQTDSKAQEASP